LEGHEAKSGAQASSEEEGKAVTWSMNKKQKTNESDENRPGEEEELDVTAEFEDLCKGVPNHLTVVEMHEILYGFLEDM
jgi:hypothetical protein